jgi:hypothetical protein
MTGIVGYAKCPGCDRDGRAVRLDRNNKLYLKCPQPPDGCGLEHWTRSAESGLHLARRITRWENPGLRRQILGDEALPAKARRQPAPAEPPAPPPAPPAAPPEEPPDEPPAEPETPPTDAPAENEPPAPTGKRRRRPMPQFIKDKIAARKAGKGGKRGFFDGW